MMANIRVAAQVVTSLSALVAAATVSAAVHAPEVVVNKNYQSRAFVSAVSIIPAKQLADVASITDDTIGFDVEKVLIEVATVTEDVALTVETEFADDVTLADVAAFEPGKVETDAVTAIDAIDSFDVAKVETDSTTVDDAATFDVARADSDSVTVVDDAATFDVARADSDSVTVADDAALAVDRVDSDAVTVADAVNSFDIGKGESDTVATTDAIDQFTVGKTLTDEVTVADALSAFSVDTAVDSTATTDEIASFEVTKPDLTDAVTVADAASLEPGKVETDAVTVADDAVLAAGKSETDTVTATDGTPVFDVAKAETDDVTVADADTKNIQIVADPGTGGGGAEVTVVDAIAFNFAVDATDTATATDGTPVFEVLKELADAATVEDSIALQLILGQTTPLYDFVFTSDDKFTYFPVPGTLNSHLVHQPVVNGEFVLTTDPNAGIVYNIRTESEYTFAGYTLNGNQLN